MGTGKMIVIKSLLWGILAVLIVGLGLTACGGGGSSTGGAGPSGGGGGTPPVVVTPTPTLPLAVTCTGAPGVISLSAGVTRSSGVAPLAVFFDATATTSTSTSRPFHDIEYRWDFGDPGSGTWARGSRPGVSSKNTATGPVAAHVFETPNLTPYTVTITAFDGVNTATCQLMVTVQDPDVVFSGLSTTCVSTSGNFAGCPAGAAQITTSNFVTAIGNITVGNSVRRLLFRRGKTWTAAGTSTLSAGGPGIVGAFPAVGAAPIVQMTGNTTLLNISNGATPTFSDWRVMDLEIDLQSGASTRAVSGAGNASQVLFLRLNIHDGHNGFTFSDPGIPNWNQIFIVDTNIARIIGGGGGYGAFMSAIRLGFLGNLVDDVSLAEHNIRFPYLGQGVISNNTLNRPGSSGKALIKLHAPDFPTIGAFTEKVVISDNSMTSNSPNWMYEIQPQTFTVDERLRDIIIERNFFQAGAGFNSPVIGLSGSEITVRNNIADITGSISFTGFQLHREGIEPPPDQMRVYNNSFYSGDAGAAPRFIIAGVLSTNITIKNNLAYAPNMTPVVSMISDLSAGGVIASNNTSNAQVTGTAPAWASITPAVIADYALTAPSYLAGDSTVPVFSDFFGTVRPNTGVIDIGATEF